MATTRGTLSPAQLLEPGLRSVFNDVGNQREAEYTMFHNMLTSKRRFEEDAQFVMLAGTPLKPEGTATLFDDPVPNPNQKRYVHLARGLATRITHEAQEDELYGQVKKVPASMANSNLDTMEQSGINAFINGFTTEVDINGTSIFNNTHTLLDGSTFDNLSSTAFSFTGVQEMQNYYEGLSNDRGLVIKATAALILIHPNNRYLAREIFQSNPRPFTADNTMNSIEQTQWMTSHYATSQTNWFALGDNKETMWPNWFQRESPTFFVWDDNITGDVLNRTYMRYSSGFTLAQGAFGSNA